ncbi:hypothetical protein ASPZODRAFT_28925 [Penicilliopsis zonata CBS 506.65]|uniref:ferric-chelate reductase (NADPH) n=1 Tax=Penicilliopsis zonata CBS 506.65 TaxID=1073090 RepID=A0A1L9S6S7_9EURO|nr:hypothetical protein ASPZODRAFT_28925 [Penicilliopsis zonata CBS 506.65]OJJ42843.1 hypothetical protein ASPZODRAFT_28925 [Penicilliopsis zonata CBS 506.65]
MGVQIAGSDRMQPDLSTPLLVMGMLLLVMFGCRAATWMWQRRRLREILSKNPGPRHQGRFAESSRAACALKRHVRYAPLFAHRHSRELRLLAGRLHMGTVPLRLEAALLVGYMVLNVVFILSLVDWWQTFPEKMYQLKYAAGHLAVMNLPALVLTAGRNNPLIPLLGLSFDTFNLVHRWLGRLVGVEAVVHMACVLSSMVYRTGWEATAQSFQKSFYFCGLTALIGFVVIFVQALSPIRHAFYEFFLHFHIALAIMAFAGLWYHLQGLTQQRVLMAALILWGLDRIGRFVLLAWRNCGKRRTTARLEFLPGSVVRVDVVMARPWSVRAGQYAYLYVPSLGLWTSHPFSVAWSGRERSAGSEKRSSNDSFNALLGGKEQTTVSFLVKKRGGFTRRLLEKVERSVDCRLDVAALAEGPFGGIHSLVSYGTVVLVAGGIGITHPMSYLHQLMQGFATTTATRRVNLVWVVREIDHLSWIQPWMTSLFAHPSLTNTNHANHYFQFPCLSLRVDVYVTCPSWAVDGDYSFATTPGEIPWTHAAPPAVPVRITNGKPAVSEIVAAESAAQVGAMAVSVCGPGGLGDDVRRAMDYVEYCFSWLLANKRGRDAKLFTKGAAFAEFPKPTIALECALGPSGSTMSVEHGPSPKGDGRFPTLKWPAGSAEVKEYVIVSEDPDAPLPKPIIHGIYYGIPADRTSVGPEDFKAGEAPGVLSSGFLHGKTMRGVPYIAPKPLLGHGPHRYFYTLIALGEPINRDKLSTVTTADEVAREIEGKVVGWGEWVGSFERKWEER